MLSGKGHMEHAHCMLDTYDYKYTHSGCDTHFFFTETMVEQTSLVVRVSDY